MLTPVDRFFAAKCIKKEIDAAYKDAETEAAIYLDEAREHGMTALTSTFFGEEAGEYKRGRSYTKHVTTFALLSTVDLEQWVEQNSHVMYLFAMSRIEEFGEWCVTNTGEIPGGIEKCEYDIPPRTKAPQVYRYDHERVKQKLAEGGNILEGANRLLLGDGDE